MAITKDVENGVGMHDAQGNEARQPLLIHQKESSADSQGSIWMVLLSTAVVVCGSFEFGSCHRRICEVDLQPLHFFLTAADMWWPFGCFRSRHSCYLLLLLGLVFVPESPRWLAKVGNQKEFTAALQKLRGEDADITQEAEEIQEYIEDLQTLPKAGIQDLFQSIYIRSVIVGVGLMVFQQIGGINGVGFYASEIFVSAGFSSGKLGTILMGSIQVPITIVGALLMDRSGRIPLLMVSASGTFLGCFITGTSFFLKAQGIYMEWVPTLALCGILVYVGAFSIGMGAVPWVIMSEVFPINIKGIGGSLVTLVNWFGSWAVSYAFNFLMSWSSAGTFFIFSAANAATIVFVAMVVPETKGRSLEEIQESLNSSK